MSNSIKLHPEKGLNPIMTFCERCHESDSIIIAGRAITAAYKGTCPDCETVVYCTSNVLDNTPREQEAKCPCGRYLTCTRISDHEPIPYGLCQKCQDELAVFEAEVAAGGVYFKCKGCKISGVIKADSELAIRVRQHANIMAPEPVGLEFNECDEHKFINNNNESEDVKNAK